MIAYKKATAGDIHPALGIDLTVKANIYHELGIIRRDKNDVIKMLEEKNEHTRVQFR